MFIVLLNQIKLTSDNCKVGTALCFNRRLLLASSTKQEASKCLEQTVLVRLGTQVT